MLKMKTQFCLYSLYTFEYSAAEKEEQNESTERKKKLLNLIKANYAYDGYLRYFLNLKEFWEDPIVHRFATYWPLSSAAETHTHTFVSISSKDGHNIGDWTSEEFAENSGKNAWSKWYVHETVRLHWMWSEQCPCAWHSTSGELSKIRANLRLQILNVLRGTDQSASLTNFHENEWSHYNLIHEMIIEYFQWMKYNYSAEIFAAEIGHEKSKMTRNQLEEKVETIFKRKSPIRKDVPILLNVFFENWPNKWMDAWRRGQRK